MVQDEFCHDEARSLSHIAVLSELVLARMRPRDADLGHDASLVRLVANVGNGKTKHVLLIHTNPLTPTTPFEVHDVNGRCLVPAR